MTRASSALIALAIFASASSTFAADPPGDPARGKAVFDRNCVFCHGPGMHGGALLAGTASLQAKYRGQVPPVLEERNDLQAAYVMLVVRRGAEGMPFFRPTEVTNQELRDLAAYLTRNATQAGEAASDAGVR
jgi:mono/diheme cytochrome c family protein